MSDQQLASQFDGVTEWIFDLDNTLYPRHCDLFGEIDQRMTTYVSQLLGIDDRVEARKVQKSFYRAHGTTLRGLMTEHNADPHHFLDFVHDIDYTPVPRNRELGELIAALPGRKFVFTNGDTRHAERTLSQLDISHVFNDIFDILQADLVPKPDPAPYRQFVDLHDVDSGKAAFFEDMSRNLEVPKAHGMRTVLVVPQDGSPTGEYWEHEGADHPHIDHVTDDLPSWLKGLVAVLPLNQSTAR